jgi:PHD/YefM family antitoxin component YafN of YafNO toxin-antitoxin module
LIPETINWKKVMKTHAEQYITDREGNRVAVVLELHQYEAFPEALEELEDLRAYDRAKTSGDEVIPFAQALREIEAQRP